MIKTFQKYNKSVRCYEVVKINLDTGDFIQFSCNITPNNELVKFSQYKTDAYKMGYKQPKDFLKRAKELGYQQVENNFLDGCKLYDPFIYTMEERMELIKAMGA